MATPKRRAAGRSRPAMPILTLQAVREGAPEKPRERAIVGDTPMQHQQAADLSHAVLLLLQWLAGAIQGRPQTTFVPTSPIVTQAATDSLGTAPLQELHSKIDALQAELAEVKQLLTAERGEVIKEAYTVEEVAKRTDLAPYTIRQACNTKRIKGRTRDGIGRGGFPTLP